MLQKKVFKINKKRFIRHWSDDNHKIHKVGTNEYYVDTIDVYPTEFVYEETDILMTPEEIQIAEQMPFDPSTF